MQEASDLFRRWWSEAPLYIFAALCAAAMVALWHAHNVTYDNAQTTHSLMLYLVSAGALFLLDIILFLARTRPASPIAALRGRYFTAQTARILIGSLPAMALCVMLIPVFSNFKSMLPLFTDYTWDRTFIAWDRFLFFGNDPWAVMQPVIGHPPITAAIAFSYHLWILLLYPGYLFFAFYSAVSPDVRRRFFLAYAISWSVVGGVMATLFASVGPVFAEPLLGITTYVPQMEYLNAANQQVTVMTLSVQDLLLERYATSTREIGSGITAMPSMHVAISVLFWLAMREVSPRAGRFFFWFFILIWIGSVHTAYHYAVDGLVSLIAMAAIWWLTKPIFALWDRVPFPAIQPTLRMNTAPAE